MKNHWNYLKTVTRHKWHVFWSCLKVGAPIHRAILHDWTKLTPREWSPYVHNFYNKDGTKRQVRDASGAYDPNSQPMEFKYAWLSHQRNKHHWQAWVSLGDGGKIEVLPIPKTYLREMVADWMGAGLVYSGKADPVGWYLKNRDSIVMERQSRIWLESLMGSSTNESQAAE